METRLGLSGFTGAYARAMSQRFVRALRPLLAAIAVLLVSIFWAYGQYGKGTIFFQ